MSATANWLKTCQVRCDVDGNLWPDQQDGQDVHKQKNLCQVLLHVSYREEVQRFFFIIIIVMILFLFGCF